MTDISLRPARPADLSRRMFLAGLIPAVAATLVAELPQFDAEKECKGGAFSSGFSSGFDVGHCDVVVRKTGREIFRVPMPK